MQPMVFQPHRNQGPSSLLSPPCTFDFASAQTHMLWTSLLNHIAIPQRTGKEGSLGGQFHRGVRESFLKKSVLELGLERWGQC